MTYVYAVEHPDGKWKVGVSKHPEYRVLQLNCSSPYDLVLKYTIDVGDGVFNTESDIHDTLSEHHITGEWFDVGEETLLETMNCAVDDSEVEGWNTTGEDTRDDIWVAGEAFDELKAEKPSGVTWGHYLTEMRTLD